MRTLERGIGKGPRRYLNAAVRFAFTENWEFVLSYARGELPPLFVEVDKVRPVSDCGSVIDSDRVGWPLVERIGGSAKRSTASGLGGFSMAHDPEVVLVLRGHACHHRPPANEDRECRLMCAWSTGGYFAQVPFR